MLFGRAPALFVAVLRGSGAIRRGSNAVRRCSAGVRRFSAPFGRGLGLFGVVRQAPRMVAVAADVQGHN